MTLTNKEAKKLASYLGKIGCIPVGSYGRNSHLGEGTNEKVYGDFDALTLKPLTEVYKKIHDKFDQIEVLMNGTKYMSLYLDNHIQLDIWKTDKENFWETYSRHIIEKNKLIYINKFLKNN
jgi:hypothetical protein